VAPASWRVRSPQRRIPDEVEGVHHHQLEPPRQAQQRVVDQPHVVVERRPVDEAVVGPERHSLTHAVDRGEHLVVLPGADAREPGGARRELQRDDRLRAGRNPRDGFPHVGGAAVPHPHRHPEGGQRLRFGSHLARQEDQPRPGQPDHVTQNPGEVGVHALDGGGRDQQGYRAEQQNREQAHRCEPRLRADQHHDIRGAEPLGPQPRCAGARLSEQVGRGPPFHSAAAPREADAPAPSVRNQPRVAAHPPSRGQAVLEGRAGAGGREALSAPGHAAPTSFSCTVRAISPTVSR
jgi:hypothetical protein